MENEVNGGAWRAFFWDIDGVFVDTESLHFRAWQEMLKEHGIDLSLQEYAPMIGRGSKENMAELCSRYNIRDDQEELQYVRRERYVLLREQGVPPLPENVAFARACKDLYPEVMQIAVSSATRSDIEENLVHAGLIDFFVHTISFQDREGMVRKPAPDMYRYACERSAVSPGQALAFEDSAHGIQAAHAAGIHSVALPNHLTRYQDLSQATWTMPYGKERTPQELARVIAQDIPDAV